MNTKYKQHGQERKTNDFEKNLIELYYGSKISISGKNPQKTTSCGQTRENRNLDSHDWNTSGERLRADTW